jgi:hypothetical protein
MFAASRQAPFVESDLWRRPMAPDFSFDDTPTMQRSSGTPLEATEGEDSAVDVDMGLSALMGCANLLLNARRDQKISFRPGVTAAMLETMGILLMRAAHANKDKRFAMVQYWVSTGPGLIEDLIKTVAARDKRFLHPNDVTMLLGLCPPDGD